MSLGKLAETFGKLVFAEKLAEDNLDFQVSGHSVQSPLELRF